MAREAEAASVEQAHIDLEGRIGGEKLGQAVEELSGMVIETSQALHQATAPGVDVAGANTTQSTAGDAFSRFLKHHTEIKLQGSDQGFQASTVRLLARARRMRGLLG